MPGKPWAIATLILALCAGGPAPASEFYEWKDELGVSHFASSLDDVPAKYRNQIKSEPSAGAKKGAGEATVPPKPADAAKGAGSTAAGGASPRRFEVPYQAYEGSARRVIIPVMLNDSIVARMALDTGAPGMVIGVDLAQRLGLFSQDKGTLLVGASGIGGTEVGILTVVDSVSVEGARSGFVPTTVTGTRFSKEFEGLIGMEFLANYNVHIDGKTHMVVFEEAPCGPECHGGHDEEWWRKTFGEFRAARDQWQARERSLDENSSPSARSLAAYQARESDRLLQRLHVYASDNAVPQHWR